MENKLYFIFLKLIPYSQKKYNKKQVIKNNLILRNKIKNTLNRKKYKMEKEVCSEYITLIFLKQLFVILKLENREDMKKLFNLVI